MLESPRYLLQKGQVKKATRILARVSSWNGIALPPGELVTQEEKERIVAEQQDQVNISEAYNIQTANCDDTKHRTYGTVGSKDQTDTAVSEPVESSSEQTRLLDTSKLPVLIYYHYYIHTT